MRSIERHCDGCPVKHWATIVPSYGNPDHPPIYFVAESPGKTEEEQGRPLIGPTGKFLRKMVEDLGSDPDEHYYGNTCMCALYSKPSAEHVNACYGGLMDEIETVRPKLIVALGDISAKAIGQYPRGIRSVHGQYRELQLADGERIGILPTYHPAAIFRNIDLFRDLAFDLDRAIEIAVRGHVPYIAPPVHNYVDVDDYDTLWMYLDEIERHAKLLAVDLETLNRDAINGTITDLGLSWRREFGISINWELIGPRKIGDYKPTHDQREAFAKVKELMERIPCSMQTASFDYNWFIRRGIRPNLVWDTEIGDWLLDERQGGHDLDSQATRRYWAPQYKERFRTRHGVPAYVNDDTKFLEMWARIPDHPRRIYNATDSDYTYRITLDQRKELKELDMLRLMRLLIDATKMFSELYQEGMWVDWDYIDRLERKYEDLKAAELAELYKMAPDVNPNSPKKLAAYLFDQLELDPFGVPADGKAVPEENMAIGIASITDPEARKYYEQLRSNLFQPMADTEEGEFQDKPRRGLSSRSTSAYMLWYLAGQHDYPRHLARYRSYAKFKRTYTNNVRKWAGPDGRVRPDYKLDGTTPGRFKSSKPAIHNLPLGPELYDMYMAPPGYMILHADYHQADLRMMAFFSGDEQLKVWLLGDPHTEVVKVIHHLTDEDIAKMDKYDLSKRRNSAKMVNFGIPYGRSAKNLAPQMEMTLKEAQTYIDEYWKRTPLLKRWVDSWEKRVMENGQEAVSPFGNRRRFPLVMNRQHRRRVASLGLNFCVMASVNYITTLGQIYAVRMLREAGIDCKVYPHIHDSFNVCVPEEDVDEAKMVIARAMKEATHYLGIYDVRFPVEVQAGRKWGTMETVFDGVADEEDDD